MQIKILPLGQLKTNCYILYNDKNCIVIDPADEADYICDTIERLGVKPVAIIATHGHFDHNLAAGELQLIYKVPYYIHPKDLFLLKEINSSVKYWLKIDSHILLPETIENIDENTDLKLGDEKFEIISTPGHTPGSICLMTKNEIFTGDTLFNNDIGRTDFSYSDKKQMDQSLKKLFKLPNTLIVYPGHGDQTTIADEKKN